MPTPQKVVALLNTSAGSFERQGGKTLYGLFTSALQKSSISASTELVLGSELRAAAERAVAKAMAGEVDAIVVGGGDGSIRTVAAVLAGSDVPLGILPLGTLNHFAKDLGIPPGIDEAIAVIAAGASRRVDVGEVNGEIFVNNSSIGIYPHLVFERERRRRKAGLSKWTAMILAGWRVLRHLPLRRLTISTQGWIEPCRSPCVFVGNNEYRLTIPAFGKRERLDGGALCLYVSKTQDRLSLVWLACRLIIGLLDQQRDFQVLKASAAEIRSRTSRLLVACDGEVVMIRSPLHYKIRPADLHLFAPARTGR